MLSSSLMGLRGQLRTGRRRTIACGIVVVSALIAWWVTREFARSTLHPPSDGSYWIQISVSILFLVALRRRATTRRPR
jgi:hypothetical protein